MGNVVSQPSSSFSLASADQDVSNSAQKVLLVGQIGSGGSVADGSWTQNIGNSGEENALFQRDSMLGSMVRGFKKIAPQVQVDALALDDAGGGTARVVTIGITGTATEQGTLVFTVGSDKLHKFSLAVANGEASATTLANATTLINADLDVPFTASVVSTNLTLTAVNAGTIANDLGIEVTGSVAGLTVGAVTEGTAGATDPTLTSILDVIGTTRYQAIVWPYSQATTVLSTLLDARFNSTNAVLDGVGITCAHDTFANLSTDLADASKNTQTLVFLCDEKTTETGFIGPAQNEPSYLKSTYLAAIRALRLTPDVAISQYVTTSASLDQFGGPALASLPYFNTPIPQLSLPAPGRGFTETEIEQLTALGGSVLGQNPAGSAAIAGEITTTYLTDGAGNSDITWKYLNYVDTASQAREYMHNNVRARFAQSRLTQGRVTAGRDMANALTIKSYMVKLYNDLASPAYSLVQDGEDAVNFFKNNLTVTIDMALGKATITMKLPIVTQLRTIIATVKIDFDINQ